MRVRFYISKRIPNPYVLLSSLISTKLSIILGSFPVLVYFLKMIILFLCLWPLYIQILLLVLFHRWVVGIFMLFLILEDYSQH